MKARPLSPAGSRLMTVADVAALFSVHERTIFVWISSGRLPPPLRIGPRVVRWKREAIEALLAEDSAKTG